MSDDRREIDLALRQGLVTPERLAALGEEVSLDRLVELGAVSNTQAAQLRSLAAMAAADTIAEKPPEAAPRADAETVVLDPAEAGPITEALAPARNTLGAVEQYDLDDPPSITGYRVGRLLGRGGTGAVWEAEELSTGASVALKVLDTALAENPSIRTRFLRESRAALDLDHPCVVRVRAAAEEDGVCYIAFDRVVGRPLSALLDGKPLGADRAARWARDLADALVHAHEHRVFHRDVKPSNVCITNEWKVVLLDFGLARPADASKLTASGEVLGTPGYMSPEQLLCLRTDARTDVYGLGATLYAMVEGGPPFPHTGLLQHREALLRAPAPELSPSAPRGLAAIVRRCLEREPERRYETMEALRDDLDRFLLGHRTLAQGEQRARSRARAVWATLAVAACVGAGALFAHSTKKEAPKAAPVVAPPKEEPLVEMRGTGKGRLFAFDNVGAADVKEPVWEGDLPAQVRLGKGSWLLDASCRVPFTTPETTLVEVPSIAPQEGFVVVAVSGKRVFLIGKCETTLEEYLAWVDSLPAAEAAGRAPRNERGKAMWKKHDPAKGEPVRGISWDDAAAFAAAKGARLPTLDEWTLACEGADGRPYPWGSGLDERRANFANRAGRWSFSPCGTYPRGEAPCGAMDLFGNVGEWVEGGSPERRYARGVGRTDAPDRWCEYEIEVYRGDAPRPEVGVRLAKDP